MDRQTASTNPDTSTPPEIVIQPPERGLNLELAGRWRYRELLFFLAWRDNKVRYKQTTLGAAWAVLQPLLTMAIYSVIFGLLVARLLHQMFMHSFTVPPGSFLPGHHHALIQMEGRGDRLQRAAVRDQRRHDDHQSSNEAPLLSRRTGYSRCRTSALVQR